MADKLLIPIDGYIEAQEAWHKFKMKKHAGPAAKKQRLFPLTLPQAGSV